MTSLYQSFCSFKSVFLWKKTTRSIINSIIIFVFTGYLLCYGENRDNGAFTLFRETQEASVFHLDNGMEVILVENHASPMISAFTIVKTGSRNEDASTNGTAHFLEHLLFNGTGKRTQKQIYDEMDFYGGYNNANTGPDYTNYMILMPKEYIARGMDIQSDMLFNSTLPVEKFEKERGIVIEEIGKDSDRPEYQVNNHFLRSFYAGTPYERPVLGSVSTISHLNRENVLTYYKTWYAPNNMTLMVIGDFSTPEMAALVKEKYGAYPAAPLPERKPILLKPSPKFHIIHASGMGKFPEDRQYLTMGYVLPPPTTEDLQALQLLTEFLGGRKDSILEKIFKQEPHKDMVNEISAGFEFNGDFSTLQISAELPLNTEAEQVVKLVMQAVQDMAEKPVSSGELQSALTASAIHEIYLQEKLHYYAMMKSGYLAAGGYDFLRNYMDGIFQVTPQSIRNASARYLRTQIPVVTLMSPPPTVTGTAAKQSTNRYHRETLKNGLTVVVKENQDSRVIGVHLLARERSLSEGKNAWGMAEILQRMLPEGGTTEHPGESLSQELESIGAELKLYDDPNIPYDDYYNSPRFTYIRLKLVDTFFERGLGLLAEIVTCPLLTTESFEQAKKQVVSLSTIASSSTPKAASRLLYDHLFKENPGLGWSMGDYKRLEQLQLEQVQTFYRKFYNPANLMLVISGNLPIESVMKTVRSCFSDSWGEAGWQPPSFVPEFRTPGSTVREKLGKQQSYVSLANTFEAEEKDMPALHILGNLFSDRLAFNLREKQGLAYTIGVHFEKYENARWYHITMGTRPENIERAVAGIQEEITALRKATFEADEVQKTINSTLGSRGMRRLDRVNQAYFISMEILDGNGPEADDQYPEKLKTVTPQELSQLAQKVFQHDNPLTVIVE